MNLWHKLALLVLALACLLEQVMAAPKKASKPAPKKAAPAKPAKVKKNSKVEEEEEDED